MYYSTRRASARARYATLPSTLSSAARAKTLAHDRRVGCSPTIHAVTGGASRPGTVATVLAMAKVRPAYVLERSAWLAM